MRRSDAVLIALVGLAGCHRAPPTPPLVANPRAEIGAPWRGDGAWFYPAEDYTLDETGIATIDQRGAGLTANGEKRDPAALTAAMQTLQLPAIVRVTNLETGLALDLRVNDRGPAAPGRIIAVSPRAASLLGIASAGSRVRVTEDGPRSHTVFAALGGGHLAIATAPRSAVRAEPLSGPGAARTLGEAAPEAAEAAVPDRMPERLMRVATAPGALFLRADSFSRAIYADREAARLAGLGAVVQRSREGRESRFSVRAGPYPSIEAADRALASALAAGIPDARITVE